MSSENGEKKDKSLFATYNTLLIRFPLLINGVQAAILAGLGVVISQLVTGDLEYDWLEIRTMMVISLVFSTPILLWFFKQLERMQSGIIVKLLVDQLLFSPPFTAGIVALRLFLVGTPLSDIPQLVLTVVPKAMMSSWMFWFPQRFLTLKYVPPAYQLLCGNVCALAWNVIFTMILTAK